jgi:hypothetical protein
MGLIDEKNLESKISCNCPFYHRTFEPRFFFHPTISLSGPLIHLEFRARILGPFWREKIRGFCRKSAPPYFNVHKFTMLVRLWSYIPTNPRLSNWLWMRAQRWHLQSPNAMSMVCERGWRVSGGFWLVSPFSPFWNGIQTSKVVTSSLSLQRYAGCLNAIFLDIALINMLCP